MEIERKFLVADDSWRSAATAAVLIRQGYLTRDPERCVRVRTKGGKAFLTVKGLPKEGEAALMRAEFEYAIPAADADTLLRFMCLPPVIEKTRHHVPGPDGKLWEVDEFITPHAGLVLAEIELAAPDEAFVPPAWLGREVTHDPRYANQNIANAILDG